MPTHPRSRLWFRYTSSMRNSLIIPGMLVSAIVLAGALYLFGGSLFTQPLGTPPVAESTLRSSGFDTIVKGQIAASQDRRVNYRIRTADEFAALWTLIYSNNGPSIPVIDFSREEVIAVFDGSHSTSGYGVEVTGIREEGGMRIIAVTRYEPGDECAVTSGIESPFHIIRVPASTLPLTKEETFATSSCR